MSRKPENQFVSGVHRYLPPEANLPRWKMCNPYVAGIWDWYYVGDRRDLWIEYKYHEIPKRQATVVLPEVSELQQAFGRTLYSRNKNIAVVVGCKEGAVVYRDMAWEKPLAASEFRKRVITRQELAAWIRAQV